MGRLIQTIDAKQKAEKFVYGRGTKKETLIGAMPPKVFFFGESPNANLRKHTVAYTYNGDGLHYECVENDVTQRYYLRREPDHHDGER